MGKKFGSDLTEKEVNWFLENEYVQTVEDLIWRRTKIGLRLSKQEIKVLDLYIKENIKEKGHEMTYILAIDQGTTSTRSIILIKISE